MQRSTLIKEPRMSRNSVKALELATFNSASLSSSYQAIDADGFLKSPFFIRIVNAASTAITVSYDGTTDNEYIPANGVFELNSQQNAQPNNWVCKWPIGTVVYIKGTAGTGTIALSGYYQEPY